MSWKLTILGYFGYNCKPRPQCLILHKLAFNCFGHTCACSLRIRLPDRCMTRSSPWSVLQHPTVIGKKRTACSCTKSWKRPLKKSSHIQYFNPHALKFCQQQSTVYITSQINKVKPIYDKIGNRFTMDVCRADGRRTTSQYTILHGSTPGKIGYWPSAVRRQSPQYLIEARPQQPRQIQFWPECQRTCSLHPQPGP